MTTTSPRTSVWPLLLVLLLISAVFGGGMGLLAQRLAENTMYISLHEILLQEPGPGLCDEIVEIIDNSNVGYGEFSYDTIMCLVPRKGDPFVPAPIPTTQLTSPCGFQTDDKWITLEIEALSTPSRIQAQGRTHARIHITVTSKRSVLSNFV